MQSIDIRTRQPRNLVSSGDSLLAGALQLTNTGATATLPDTTTTRTLVLSANTRAISVHLDVSARIAIGPGAVLGSAVLGPGHYVLLCPSGSQVVAQRFAGTGASENIHIAELA